MTTEIFEDVALAPMTTMRVGGNARYLAHVKTLSELSEAVTWAKEKGVPFFVLGGGSNTLVSDEGFPGLVIKIEIGGVAYEHVHHGIRASVGAGEIWDEFVRDAVLRDLWGVENLSLIPGTVGGAAVQNIGAYGVEVRELISEIETFDIETAQRKIFPAHKCKFGYRDSMFKHSSHLVVTRVVLNLTRDSLPRMNYKDVKKYFEDRKILHPTIQNMRDAIIAIRVAKMPGNEIGSAGSFFKDPLVTVAKLEEIKRQFPEIKAHLLGAGGAKLSAAWILDKVLGIKGVRRGNVGVSEKHSLILVNYGAGKSAEIVLLANEIKKSVAEKIGVVLEEEVVVL